MRPETVLLIVVLGALAGAGLLLLATEGGRAFAAMGLRALAEQLDAEPATPPFSLVIDIDPDHVDCARVRYFANSTGVVLVQRSVGETVQRNLAPGDNITVNAISFAGAARGAPRPPPQKPNKGWVN